MNSLVSQAISELTEVYRPAFIILYGSFARGDDTLHSDIDIACFCDEPSVEKDIREFHGRKLDCWLYHLNELDADRDDFLRFIGGQLFYDDQGLGRTFMDKLEQRYRKGPKPITPDSRAHLIEWSKNMLQRASGDDIEARFRRTWLPCECLEIYFQLRNQFYLGSKQSFHWLKVNEPKAYAAFDEAYHDPTNMSVLTRLVSLTLEGVHNEVGMVN